MTNTAARRYIRVAESVGTRIPLRRLLKLPVTVGEYEFFPLLLSATLAEVAGNMVYVMLMERAYQLGEKVASVGGVLLVQAVVQVVLGGWAGGWVDRLGKRQAALLATLAYAILAIGLVVGQTITTIYLLASLITLSRLVLIPARQALVPHVSSKANLVITNTGLAVVTSVGLFLGPAISVVLTLLTHSFTVPIVVAGLTLLLSALPLLSLRAPGADASPTERVDVWREMRAGWRFVRKRNSVWHVILCLMHLTIVMGAVIPLTTPLARHFGLASEGTGIFLSAIGLGGLIGAPLAILLFKRTGPSTALLLTGLFAPTGIFLAGLMNTLGGALVAVLLASVAAAGLNIVVITVLQRLTPIRIQGSVFGVLQTLLGLAWVGSLATVTGGMAVWPEEMGAPRLLQWIGGVGFLMALSCWLRYRREIQIECVMCGPEPRVSSIFCRAVRTLHFPPASTTCQAICRSHCQNCHTYPRKGVM